MQLSLIDDNLTIYKNKSVIIWGASSAGEKMYLMLKAYNIHVIAFCDSNSAKWGLQLFGLEIVSPDQLEKKIDESVIVQIASTWENEIAAELKRRNVINFVSYGEANTRLANLKKYQFSREHKDLYKYILNGKCYFPFFYEWEDLLSPFVYESEEVVLLCMPPKTGDHTMMYTLEKHKIPYVNLWHTTRKYSKEFAQVLANKKIKVITATRDIISQNLSLLFELMDLMYWDCDEYWKDGGDVDALFAKWIKDLREYEGGNRKTNDLFQTYKDYTLFTCSIQSFFENEFKDLCGVNLYEYEFDKRKGYSIIRKDNVEVFVYQIEKLNQISNELLDFLNIESGELVNGNQASMSTSRRYDTQLNTELKRVQKNIESQVFLHSFCLQLAKKML